MNATTLEALLTKYQTRADILQRQLIEKREADPLGYVVDPSYHALSMAWHTATETVTDLKSLRG